MALSNKQLAIFVSHASADNNGKDTLVDNLYEILQGNYKVFCSSVPKRGIPFGKKLFQTLNNNLHNCNIFVAVITDNYIRSGYCLYEFCVARYLNKKILSIYANSDLVSKMETLQDKDIVSLIANQNTKNNGKDAEKLISTLKLPKEKLNKISAFLDNLSLAKSDKPYFGMSLDEYKRILTYCNEEGIERIFKGHTPSQEVIKHFSNAKKIYIVSTTGAGLLKTVKANAIPSALRNGAEIIVIMPDKNSAFCNDVAVAECKQDNFSKVIEEQNQQRIYSEFDSAFQYLNEAYEHARKDYVGTLGTIKCYCSQTLFRQTIVITIDGDNKAWGWTTMTMPPLRTTDCPTFSINGTCSESSLISLMINHCECIRRIAEDRGEYREITGETLAHNFNSKNLIAEQYWKAKQSEAKEFMSDRRKTYSNVLIEVAAQHPLYNGRVPNDEFAKRLDLAVELYHRLTQKDCQVFIYVPGSRHKHNGICDEISLSQAGKEYLMDKGIDTDHIYADEVNVKFKGEDGVYNSADECYVSSQIFKKQKFGRLICVCSTYQTIRKTLFYIEQGLLPECYGVPSEQMHHNAVSEYFHSLTTTVYNDHDWQDSDSPLFRKSREERKVEL